MEKAEPETAIGIVSLGTTNDSIIIDLHGEERRWHDLVFIEVRHTGSLLYSSMLTEYMADGLWRTHTRRHAEIL